MISLCQYFAKSSYNFKTSQARSEVVTSGDDGFATITTEAEDGAGLTGYHFFVKLPLDAKTCWQPVSSASALVRSLFDQSEFKTPVCCKL
jgi:hypothetical protein